MNIPLTNSEIFEALSFNNSDQAALSEYSQADIVILQCPDDFQPFWVGILDANNVECFCGKLCNRLLSDGTWQTAEERRVENGVKLQNVIDGKDAVE